MYNSFLNLQYFLKNNFKKNSDRCFCSYSNSYLFFKAGAKIVWFLSCANLKPSFFEIFLLQDDKALKVLNLA
ncbi:MAG: hypothetical protein CL605_11040 [Altibacter sp.]|nr:hypothetical protein [Altibacter sp.]